MIISKTPFRMSFFGGGTDYPEFFRENGGSVLSTTFDKYCYVNVRHLPSFFEYETELTYSKIERVKNVDSIEHPAIREAMKFLDIREIHLQYEADLPAKSGLGTSSSFAVGMLNVFYALKGKYADKRKLAEDAIYLERTLCAETGGIQDQIAAAYGGLNRIDFRGESFEVHPIIMKEERKTELNHRLMLFFTGFSRFSSEIAIEQKRSIKEKEDNLKEMVRLVDEAQNILCSNENLNEFGRLLDYAWKLKRGLTSIISNDTLDDIYKKAITAGAYGGKLLGAGGGGFFLFYVPEEYQESVRRALADMLYIPFEFESVGTQIIYYSPESYVLKEDRQCE